jgi:hypothetical protein
MAKSKKRKGHAKKVMARNQRIKGQQNAFIKEFKEKLDKGVAADLEKQANDVKAKEIDGTEERTMDSTMSASPIINTSTPSK